VTEQQRTGEAFCDRPLDERGGDAPADSTALDRCTCTHWHTWHRAHDQSGNFVGVNLGSCVIDDCGCAHFRSECVIPPEVREQ